MIADEVEIYTVNPDDDEARQLSLRSVHGRYLIRLLDKSADGVARTLMPHGTEVRLKVRASAEIPNIIDATRRWIVLPGCRVTAQVDGGEPSVIGYASPADALRAEMLSHGYADSNGTPATSEGYISIKELSSGGVTMAFATRWSEYFDDCSFVQAGRLSQREDAPLLLGTCIEGIRVDTNTPGFDDVTVLALANASGPDCPKTNVARSGIEATPEMQQMLRSIYAIYCAHVAEDVTALQARGYSVTWAAGEADWLVSPLFSPMQERADPLNPQVLAEAVRATPIFLIEQAGKRHLTSAVELDELAEFWTIESLSARSAEVVIKESSGQVSLTSLMRALGVPKDELPPDPLVCGLERSRRLTRFGLAGRTLGAAVIHRQHRRLDLKWVKSDGPSLWEQVGPNRPRDLRLSRQTLSRGRSRVLLYLPVGQATIEGVEDEVGIKAMGSVYLVPNTNLCDYLARVSEGVDSAWVAFVAETLAAVLTGEISTPVSKEVMRRLLLEDLPDRLQNDVELNELLSVLNSDQLTLFDPSLWARSKQD
jgi:molecular chaperone HtpG